MFKLHSIPYLSVLLFQIGLCFSVVKAQAEKHYEGPTVNNMDNEWIVVEPQYVESSRKKGTYELMPYAKRKSKWGTLVGIGYSMFEPINYNPNFESSTFENVYEKADNPLLELRITAKRHVGMLSYGVEIGLGSYGANSISSSESSLSLQVARLGGRLAVDGLSDEPHYVPYISAGAYIVLFNETLSSTSFTGNTEVSYYYSGGMMFQLNRLEKRAARVAYSESGIENTFIFVEARQFIASNHVLDPNFESDIHANVGINIEF